MEFPDYGNIWIDFCYEGLPSYCLICGKVGHVTRRCREGSVGDEAQEFGLEERFAFKGLDLEFDLIGNLLMGRGDAQKGTRGRTSSSSSSN